MVYNKPRGARVTPERIWRERAGDYLTAKAIAKACGIHIAVAKILVARGFTAPAEVDKFLRGTESHSPFGLRGMTAAVDILQNAHRLGTKVRIFGDFDVDGTCATAILVDVLGAVGMTVDYYQPDRLREGYGLSAGGVRQAAMDGVGVLVTVDLGITNVAEIALAKELGLSVVVVDHHEPGQELPPADAVIDPKQAEDTYPYKDLCGGGLAYKLADAFLDRLHHPERVRFLEGVQDLAGFATIADQVPLTGENRTIVRKALERWRQPTRAGIRAMLAVTRLTPQGLTSGQIAFYLAPQINAGSRMGITESPTKLLLTKDENEATRIAEALYRANEQRKAVEQAMTERALATLPPVDAMTDRAIVVVDDEGHSGVKGIVASRILERYSRPVFYFVRGEDGNYEGSARSVDGFNLHAAIEVCRPMLLKGGGHKMAAGASASPEQIFAFRSAFIEIANQQLGPDDVRPQLTISGGIDLADVNLDMAEQLRLLEPFGMGNPEPVLAMRSVMATGVEKMGKDGTHLRLRLRSENASRDAVFFRAAERRDEIRGYDRVDVAATLSVNEFRGQRQAQLMVRDVRPAVERAPDGGRPERQPDEGVEEKLFTHADKWQETGEYFGAAGDQEIRTSIVGVSDPFIQATIGFLHAGSHLTLRGEPENPVDPLAIQVLTPAGDPIGHLRATLAKQLNADVIAGRPFDVEITDITGGGPGKSFGVNVVVRRQAPPVFRALNLLPEVEEWLGEVGFAVFVAPSRGAALDVLRMSEGHRNVRLFWGGTSAEIRAEMLRRRQEGSITGVVTTLETVKAYREEIAQMTADVAYLPAGTPVDPIATRNVEYDWSHAEPHGIVRQIAGGEWLTRAEALLADDSRQILAYVDTPKIAVEAAKELRARHPGATVGYFHGHLPLAVQADIAAASQRFDIIVCTVAGTDLPIRNAHVLLAARPLRTTEWRRILQQAEVCEIGWSADSLVRAQRHIARSYPHIEALRRVYHAFRERAGLQTVQVSEIVDYLAKQKDIDLAPNGLRFALATLEEAGHLARTQGTIRLQANRSGIDHASAFRDAAREQELFTALQVHLDELLLPEQCG